ncbi:hypothetical protein BDU57DRAFT_195050 [Ampelomyces quisqualis]|uniref:Uncharacterized protein n=1 Tax=Ampelomyces quisqualis TaxID=50730 RepID=A0A6A5QRF0_AMPQU|nr:hypothetical protein BDU57DRAFT_195050 [Ampelomyces quisqualis]
MYESWRVFSSLRRQHHRLGNRRHVHALPAFHCLAVPHAATLCHHHHPTARALSRPSPCDRPPTAHTAHAETSLAVGPWICTRHGTASWTDPDRGAQACDMTAVEPHSVFQCPTASKPPRRQL